MIGRGRQNAACRQSVPLRGLRREGKASIGKSTELRRFFAKHSCFPVARADTEGREGFAPESRCAMIRTHYVRAFLAAAAMCAAAAPGCRAVCGPEACEDEPAEKPRRLAGRMEGRMEEWKAKAHEHFHEEPVVAPHSRFHPVPTRPVFEPPSPEELAALFPPPVAEKAGAEKDAAAKDTVAKDAAVPAAAKPPALLPVAPPSNVIPLPAADTPAITAPPSNDPAVAPPASRSPSLSPLREDAAPVQETPAEERPADEPADSPLDPPTRTAKRPPTALSSVGVPSLNSASPEMDAPAQQPSMSADEVRSTFRTAAAEKASTDKKQGTAAMDSAEVQSADSERPVPHAAAPGATSPESIEPQPSDDHTSNILPSGPLQSGPLDLFSDWDGPLLWRAVKTPSGSLRAVPASFVDGY
jgi:hypothetical protein